MPNLGQLGAAPSTRRRGAGPRGQAPPSLKARRGRRRLPAPLPRVPRRPGSQPDLDPRRTSWSPPLPRAFREARAPPSALQLLEPHFTVPPPPRREAARHVRVPGFACSLPSSASARSPLPCRVPRAGRLHPFPSGALWALPCAARLPQSPRSRRVLALCRSRPMAEAWEDAAKEIEAKGLWPFLESGS
ncbi:wiskott-Aldrich syndrome protein homolog 1-like [Phyllostomus discolor]|uniref:Wiskott-Aldrich syndrome protein homolog 1-like n=1 Tax=Phyllostomus discolor TaxID=89673 RepID=A0A7E6EDR3_9CHIR|nr:wiskott-Aldrich syndrome protein homolog 1-like [Phyllostomus discolor]XP_035889524.1 wiskott-Aldrich syndrome protein homolog 1-like [Phyllostomus discolor]